MTAQPFLPLLPTPPRQTTRSARWCVFVCVAVALGALFLGRAARAEVATTAGSAGSAVVGETKEPEVTTVGTGPYPGLTAAEVAKWAEMVAQAGLSELEEKAIESMTAIPGAETLPPVSPPPPAEPRGANPAVPSDLPPPVMEKIPEPPAPMPGGQEMTPEELAKLARMVQSPPGTQEGGDPAVMPAATPAANPDATPSTTPSTTPSEIPTEPGAGR